MDSLDSLDSLRLDYIMVADAAEVVAGKLYVLGGGWDRLIVPAVPGRPAMPFYVAFGLSVPWNLTNRAFEFAVEMLDADGGLIDTLVAGQFEVGRPPGLRAGTSQRMPLAGPAGPEFSHEGRYVIRCVVDGAVLGETAIEVTASAVPAQA
jgi:hypothetical protein